MEGIITRRMNGIVSIEEAKEIMGKNFIGVDELRKMKEMRLRIPTELLEIKFSVDALNEKKDDYLLMLGLSEFDNGEPVNIRNMIRIFGKDPEIKEPCFYNQDWYEKEDFIDAQMENQWFLIKKDVFEDSRAKQPDELQKKYRFPSAVKCCYSFFITWLCKDIKLWYHDFVWCCDKDHNEDRIYVGKYHDVDGVNKNGFSIHRHLGLRDCYGCIDSGSV